LKILNIIQRYPPAIGGAEFYCQGLSRYLTKKGHSVCVLTTDVYFEEEFWRDPSPESCLLRFGRIEYDGKIKIIRGRRNKINYFFFLIFKIMEKFLKVYFYGPHSIEMYITMFRQMSNFDIIHLYALPYPHNLVALFIAKLFRKKVIITPLFHIGHPYYELHGNYLILKKADAITALSCIEKNHYINKGLNKDRVSIVYNGIEPSDYIPRDLDRFKNDIFCKYNIKKDTKIIIFIGRKIEYKGIDTLIEATRLLKRDIPLKLFLIGPNFDWFNKYYANLSDEEKNDIIDFGVVDHQTKVNLLYLSNILVLPSKFESFGTVILEAWICGVVALTTKDNPSAEIIGNDMATFVYGDVFSLQDKIYNILQNQDLYNTLLSEAKDKIYKYFTWDIVGNKIEEIYYKLINDENITSKS
jgi:glycosyltransferase involved in cell wall biosynthesis